MTMTSRVGILIEVVEITLNIADYRVTLGLLSGDCSYPVNHPVKRLGASAAAIVTL